MGRRSSGGRLRSSGWSSPRPVARAPKRDAPKPAAAAPPPPPPRPAAAPSGSAGGGLGSAVAEGMAFGGGSAVAHRAVDAIVGPRVVRHETVGSSLIPSAENSAMNSIVGHSVACVSPWKAFEDCLNINASEIGRCQLYMDKLVECRKNPAAGGLNA